MEAELGIGDGINQKKAQRGGCIKRPDPNQKALAGYQAENNQGMPVNSARAGNCAR